MNHNKHEIGFRLGKVRKDKYDLVLKMLRLQSRIKDLDTEEKHLRDLYYEKKVAQ